LSVTGVVAALEFEARSLGNPGDGSLISVGGVGADNAAQTARALVAAGAGALLSWGVAAALDPALACGTAVLPGTVLRQGQQFETSRLWRERLLSALHGHVRVVTGALLSSEVAVGAAALKASLFRDTRAVAVDMESAAVAAVAAQHGLPFLALRVILDTARDTLPPSILRAFDPTAGGRAGRPRAAALLWPLLCAPADWGRLLRLAAQYRVARLSLSQCRRHGHPTRAGAARGAG
jgi:adenosylhomocysteine nucleosidase